MARDSYRQRVYDAEWAAFNAYTATDGRSMPNWLGGQRMESVEEIQRYVNKLIASAWFKRRWPHTHACLIKPGKGCRRAIAFSGLYDRIEMPRWSRVEWVVLHEMAHIVSPTGEKHGRWFLAAYLELLQHMLGKEAADRLKAELRSRKVPITIRKGKQAPFRVRLAKAARERGGEHDNRRQAAARPRQG